MVDIKKVSYKKYQLQWMIEHGYTVDDLVKQLQLGVDEANEGEHINLTDIYDNWEFDCGFDGTLWVCFDEFLHYEYRDKKYMKYLLDKREYDLYLLDRKQLCASERSV